LQGYLFSPIPTNWQVKIFHAKIVQKCTTSFLRTKKKKKKFFLGPALRSHTLGFLESNPLLGIKKHKRQQILFHASIWWKGRGVIWEEAVEKNIASTNWKNAPTIYEENSYNCHQLFNSTIPKKFRQKEQWVAKLRNPICSYSNSLTKVDNWFWSTLKTLKKNFYPLSALFKWCSSLTSSI
jgi:hypothetical protein